MLKELTNAKTYIVCGYTDMRHSIDGLAAIVKQNYGLEPCSGSLFLFCGKRRDRMKALLWEGDGFLLLYKRLDNGSFQWPRNNTEARLLTSEQYLWLMQGLSINQPKAIRVSEKPRDVV
jgi:transposase